MIILNVNSYVMNLVVHVYTYIYQIEMVSMLGEEIRDWKQLYTVSVQDISKIISWGYAKE